MRRFVAGIVLLAALAGAQTAAATFPGANGRIAYDFRGTTVDDQNRPEPHRAIQTVNLRPGIGGVDDHTVRECLIAGNGTQRGDCTIRYGSPAWSRNGRRLVFDAGPSLALVNSDDSGFRKLSAFTPDDGEPAWSRSGAQVVFTGKTGARTDVFVARLGSATERRLARRAASPDWSSRNRIAFERGGSVWTIGPDGSDLERVARGRDPSWSPSGRSIALKRRGGIYVVGADGDGLRRLARCSACANPAFSPNGKLVVYESGGLVVVNVATTRRDAVLVRDVRGGGFLSDASNPAWQPR